MRRGFQKLEQRNIANSSLVADPTSRQPGCDLSRSHWALLNRFRTGHVHCGVTEHGWRTELFAVPFVPAELDLPDGSLGEKLFEGLRNSSSDALV